MLQQDDLSRRVDLLYSLENEGQIVIGKEGGVQVEL